MHLGGENIPQQKLALSKKTKQWKEDCVEAFINLSSNGTSGRKDSLKLLYDYYNGVIEDSDYNYVLKPYGKTRKNFPSKMRNYPIIKPIIDLLLGEKSKRPLNYTVTVQNGDTVTEKEKAKQQVIYKNLEMQFLKVMAAENPELMKGGQMPEEIPMPEQIAGQFEDSYVDNRAIKGQYAMNYIMQEQEIYDKIQKAWFHFLVSGEVYTHRGVRHSEPFYDVLNPIDIDYDKDPDLEFVEDGDWALSRKHVHASTVIDHYHDTLTDEQVLELEQPRHSESDNYLLHSASSSDGNSFRSRLIEVVEVYWKSRKRIGFLSFIAPETGQAEEMEVEEGYKMPLELKEEGATLKWMWVNEVWGGTRVDGRFYVNIHPLENQRASLDNPSKCKLPINGRRYSDVNSKNISLVSLGIPFQLNYNIYKYRLELAIARSKDIVAQFDINMIPKKWDMDKFMYYVEGTGIAWVDYNKEGVTLSPQHQSVLDMSIKTIQQYIILLDSIMQEWEKLSGVNRQRQGEIGAYEGKASSQQAILQSSHITEDLFRKFGRLEQRDFQALLDYSKEAWLTGKKTMFVMPDGTTDYLDLDSMSHMESNYGIFVSDAGKDQMKLDQIKGLTQAMVQNGTKASTVADMLDSDSFPQIKSKLKKAEKAAEELEAAQAQAAQEAQKMQAQAMQQAAEQESLDKEKDRQKDIEIALIGAEARQNPEGDSFNLQKMMQEFELKQRELDLKEKELDAKFGETEENSSIEREKNSIQREANQNANKDAGQ
tara:strand:+ start:1241 stop:3532 length:2292 start_codon:yes stop_codon:yes gene_type:complete